MASEEQVLLQMSVPASNWSVTMSDMFPLFIEVQSAPMGADIDVYQLVNEFIKPVTRVSRLSWALQTRRGGLPTKYLVSHSWCEMFSLFLRVLESSGFINVAVDGLWICFLANPQNWSGAQMQRLFGAAVWQSPFVVALLSSTAMLVVRTPAMNVCTRLWCVLEAVFAVAADKPVHALGEGLARQNVLDLLRNCDQEHFGVHAHCSSNDDRRIILNFAEMSDVFDVQYTCAKLMLQTGDALTDADVYDALLTAELRDQQLKNLQHQLELHQLCQQLNLRQVPHAFSFNGSHVRLFSVRRPAAALGFHLWAAGMHLSQYLVEQAELAPLMPPGSYALELGCGLGLVSIVLGFLGIRTLATDGDEELVRNIAAFNVKAHSAALRAPVFIGSFSWGEDADLAVLHSKILGPMGGGAPGLVVAADCIYDPDYYAKLSGTLKRLCRLRGHDFCALVAWGERHSEQEFFDGLADTFSITEVRVRKVLDYAAGDTLDDIDVNPLKLVKLVPRLGAIGDGGVQQISPRSHTLPSPPRQLSPMPSYRTI